jgi:hypothetical protein
MDKYRYHIYPDRIYVVKLDNKADIEITGKELIELLGVESYSKDKE